MKFHTSTKIAEHVSGCLQLAILLEVSAYPKPGNIHRTADFQETKYEHFLASAVAVAPHFKFAAEQGISVSAGKISPHEIEIGNTIKNTVMNVSAWQSGGNTLLGSIILLSPIAVAAGMILADRSFSLVKLRKKMKVVVESSTPMDAVAVYDAIKTAKPSGLGKAPKLDVTDSASRQKILEDKVTLFEVFKIASGYDSIASEWVNNFPVTFDLGYPYFAQQLDETKDVNTATVHTFLRILSEVPDTLIARKVGLTKAKEVSAQAKQVLKAGGLATSSGRHSLWKLDEKLKDPLHQLNPGTTADITAAVLAISILNGYKP
ncbi:MAG: triphosphoribosyl-dephospho-CoA synthase [Candidatus Bathyarchaeota archaeon]|nr:MAG: triphosphoribosyl-dephospho-CoA synthase [Candidatus Bathyarchaeota archaeon]